MLQVESISFGYSAACDLLSDLSFTVNDGDIVCLLGPNGAGKTTLLRCLLGISKVHAGSIRVKGREIASVPAAELSRWIAYVPQATDTVFPYRVLDMAVMGRTPHIGFAAVPSKADMTIAREALRELGIAHLADCLFSEISGGERQLTLIARAITQQAGMLIMDEPTSSLDYGNQVRILKVISHLAKQGYSILMTSHFPSHAFMLCNKVLVMKHGRIIAAGSPEEIMTEEGLSDLYGAKVKIVEITDGTAGPVKVCIPLLA
jgi:iron complex transport system ATP-binding protein